MLTFNRQSPHPVPYFFLIPFFAAFSFFWFIPIGEGFLLSLHSNTLFGESVFSGLKHYRGLLEDRRFTIAMVNTLGYTVSTIAVIIPLSLVLALMLRRAFKKMRGILSFCLLLPGLTPPLVLALLFLLVFIGRYGMLNNLIVMPLGLPQIDWMKEPAFIRISLVIQAAWRWSGFITFFILSGLEGIPKNYYDIALSEGAGPFHIFRHVTLPLLRNILVFICIFLFIDAFVMFEGAYMLLGSSGGPRDAALLLVGYTYQTAFFHGNFGTAAAMSFSIVPVLVLILWFFLLQGKFGGR